MDPLSFSASLITVIAVTASSVKLLKKAREFNHLPDQLCALLNEINDLRGVLHIVEELKEDEISDEVRGSLVRLLKRAKAVFDELEGLLLASVVKAEDEDEYTRLRVSHSGWIRKQNQIRRLHVDIKDIRTCIHTTLICINSSMGQRMNFKIEQVAILQADLIQRQQSFEQRMHTAHERYLDAHTTAMSFLKNLQSKDSEALSVAPLPVDPEAWTIASDDNTRKPKSGDNSVIGIQTSRDWDRQCEIGCDCQCHNQSTFSIPTPLRFILGTLFIGYSGSIIFGSTKCNEKCQRLGRSSLHLTYYFPSWFIAKVILYSYTRIWPTGPSYSLQVSRIRPKSSDVFMAATVGDIDWLCSLFQQGKASPFDVAAEDGQSVLQHAIDGTMDTVVFLLQQGADPHHKHHFATSAADGFWRQRHRLQAAGATETDEPDEIKRVLDDPDFVDSLQLSIIHKVVFGLADIDLDQLLRISSSEINALDRTGKSPLHWAILRNDLQTTKTLLDRGADVNIHDVMRRTPLCYAVWLAKDISLYRAVLAAGPDIDARDVFDQTPLMYACHGGGSTGIEGCRILLATTGIDPDAKRWDGYTALHLSVQHGGIEQIELLIQHGATIDIENNDGSTPLVLAVKLNNHGALLKLLSLGAKASNVDLRTRTSNAVTTAAARGDRETMAVLSAADFSEMDTELRRQSIKAAKDAFAARHKGEQAELSVSFAIMMEKLHLKEH